MSRLIIAFLLYCSTSGCVLSETIYAITAEWEDYTNKDNTGVYIEIIDNVFKDTNIDVNYTYTPWIRADGLFADKNSKYDLLIGDYKTDLPKRIYPKWAIGFDVLTMIFKKGQLEWHGQTSLKNKKIAWIRGYGFHDVLKIHIDPFILVKDTYQGLNLIMAGRIDILVDYDTEITTAAQKHSIDLTQFEQHEVSTQKKIYVAFQNSKQGIFLKDLFEHSMDRMFKNDILKNIYTKWNDTLALENIEDLKDN